MTLAAQPDAARLAERAQRHVLGRRPASSRRDLDVVEREIGVEFQPASPRPAQRRVPLAGHDDEPVDEDALVRHAVRDRQQHVEREVEFPRREILLQPGPLVPRRSQGQPGPGDGDRPRQGRQHRRLECLPHADPEMAHDRRGLEAPGLAERPLHPGQRIADRAGDGPCQRCRCDAAPLALEQRLAEELTQASQRVAHGRLRQVQLAAGRRDPALAVDGIEDDEQVQVDPWKDA